MEKANENESVQKAFGKTALNNQLYTRRRNVGQMACFIIGRNLNRFTNYITQRTKKSDLR